VLQGLKVQLGRRAKRETKVTRAIPEQQAQLELPAQLALKVFKD
jgi:hypothetical protein